MIQALALLLPALVPSWRFFDVIAPSPRIEFVVLKDAEERAENWREFRPRPAHLSIFDMLKRMVWNPRWNEALFLVSCAERLMKSQSEHSVQEILGRIERDLRGAGFDCAGSPYLQFRLVFLYRDGAVIEREVTFVSSVCKMGAV